MITDRGPWSQTYTGRMFHHRDPRPDDIAIEDIAHALALQCRFGGHCRVHYCPTLDQRILTADLRWVPAGDIRVGDELLGFDEHPTEIGSLGKRRRKFRHSIVRASQPFRLPVIRLEMADGSTVRSSTNHPWLIATKAARNQAWCTTDKIAIAIRDGRSRYMHRFTKTWDVETSRDAGWLAGMFDGEGHVSFKKTTGGVVVGLAQRPGLVLDHVVITMAALGFQSASHFKSSYSDCINLQARGGWREMMKILGSLRPIRLLDKFVSAVRSGGFTRQMDGIGEPSRIVKAYDEGEEWCAGIDTSTRTYLCEGFAAHNSVAEHSVRVGAVAFALAHADGIETDGLRSIILAGLLHDASEAYLVDVPRPVKGDLDGYRAIEAAVQGAIVRRFRCGIGESWMRYVKRADEILLATEARDLMGPPADDWYLTEAPLGEVIAPWSWHVAEASFLHRFNDLCRPEDRVMR